MCRYIVTVLLVLTNAATSFAHESSGTMHHSPHAEGTAWIAGVKVAGVAELERDEDTHTGAGLSLSLERNVIEGWLEVELVATGARLAGEWLVPTELLLKKPFHFGPLCPYLALGAAATFHEDHFDEPLFGASAALGAYLWFGRHLGMDLEVTYGIMVDEGAPVQELLVGIGPAFRF